MEFSPAARRRALEALVSVPLWLRLFTGRSARHGTFEEADGPGYAPQRLPAAAWTLLDGPAAECPPVSWRLPLGQGGPAVRGLYATDDEGRVQFHEVFDEPVPVAEGGVLEVPVRLEG